MHVVVDLPAVRAGRHARSVTPASIADAVRDLRIWLRGGRVRALDAGVRVDLEMAGLEIAGLADEIRALAGVWPFLTIRLYAEPPACRLEITGQGPAAAFARVVFGEIAS